MYRAPSNELLVWNRVHGRLTTVHREFVEITNQLEYQEYRHLVIQASIRDANWEISAQKQVQRGIKPSSLAGVCVWAGSRIGMQRELIMIDVLVIYRYVVAVQSVISWC
jgi:hypothetical protein